MSDLRQDQLFEKYLGTALESADIVQLKQALGTSRAARTRFVEVLQEWQALAEVARQVHSGMPWQERGSAAAQDHDAAGEPDSAQDHEAANDVALDEAFHQVRRSAGRPSLRLLPSRRRGAFGRFLIAAASIAACALLAWGWLLPLVQGAHPEGIATVAVADAAARIQRGDQRLDIANGLALRDGDTVSVPPGSWARVRYADGTMLDIAPASEVTLSQPEKLGKRVLIASGSLTADIAKQPPERRMVFTTPTAAATVLGTKITLEVTPMSTRLEVERGRVGLTRRDEATGIEVGAGEYATIPYGSKGELVAKSIVSAPSVLVERGHGLKGEYFGNLDLAPPSLFSRVDSSLSFDLGFDTPWQDDMRPSRFSVRWTGTIEPRFSERYSFYTRSDSGVRLFIDDHAIIDDWNHGALSEKTGAIALQAGHRYALRLEYNQPRSGMLLKLSWTSPSQECEVIPAARLTPAP